MKRLALVGVWGVPLALGGVVAWLAAQPEPPLPPLPLPRVVAPAPQPRRLHDLHLTVVRARDREPVASTSADVKPRTVAARDVLYLAGTTSQERTLFVRLFLGDTRGRVEPLSPEPGPPLEWRALPDGGLPAVVRLPAEDLRGDLRVWAFVSFRPFGLSARTVREAWQRAGRPPGEDGPLGLPLPPGAAGATFEEVSVRIRRGP